MKIALVGNQNSGKTTLYNALTGKHEHIGNWAGVTVNSSSSSLKKSKSNTVITDLPGIYSMTCFSKDEKITANVIESGAVDMIINVVDATNLERSLFLTLQLIESGIPLIIMLTLTDELKKNKGKININLLKNALNVPVIDAVKDKKCGFFHLMSAINNKKFSKNPNIQIYDKKLEQILNLLDKTTHNRLKSTKIIDNGSFFSAEAERKFNALISNSIYDFDEIITAKKYEFIEKTVKICQKTPQKNHNATRIIDNIVLSKLFAVLIFAAIMFLSFSVSFGSFTSFLSQKINSLSQDFICPALSEFMIKLNVSNTLVLLITNGIVSSAFKILSFLPQIAALFLIMSILEESGYLSRAEFIADKPLRSFNLCGASFIPLLMGFGCTIPALLSTRRITDKKIKTLTLFVTPFISCSARLPTYFMIISAFFGNMSKYIIISIYAFGIFSALIFAKILSKISLKGEDEIMLFVLPPYRMPKMNSIISSTFIKCRSFVKKIGSSLLVAFIIVWVLQSFNISFQPITNVSESIFAQLGKLLSPLFVPLGFADWQAVGALLSGIGAKEMIAATFNMLSGSAGISELFTPASALSFCVFVLLYTPCAASIATLKNELNSVKQTAIILCLHFATAYISAFMVYSFSLIIFH